MLEGRKNDDLSYSQINAGDEVFELCCTRCKGKNKQCVKYCAQCKEYYCQQCLDMHNSFRGMADHVLVDTESSRSMSSKATKTYQAVPTQLCEEHPMEIVNMYCKNENKVGCHICFTLKHKSCVDTHYVPEYLQNYDPKKQIDKTCQQLSKATAKMQEVEDEINEFEEDLETSKNACEEDFEDYRKEIQNVLNEIALRTSKQVSEKYEYHKKTHNETMQNVNQTKQSLNQCHSDLNSDQINTAQKFVTAVSCEALIEQADAFTAQSLYNKDTFIFSRNTDIMEYMLNIKTLGLSVFSEKQATADASMRVNVQTPTATLPSTSDVSLTKTSDKSNETNAVAPYIGKRNAYENIEIPITGQPTFATKVSDDSATTLTQTEKVSLSKDTGNKAYKPLPQLPNTNYFQTSSHHLYRIIRKIEYNTLLQNDTRHPEIRSSCTLENGLVLADCRNNKIKLFKKETHRMMVSELSLNDKPLAVCKLNATEIAVCLDNNTILIVSTKGTLKATRSVKMKHECKCIDVNNNRLVACDKTWLYVYEADGGGITLKSVFNASPVDAIVSHLNDICVNKHGDIMIHVTDFKEGLCTYTIVGRVLWRFNRSILKGARGVCSDEFGNLFVCGEQSNNIIQLSPEGTFVGEIVTKHDGLKYPQTICYDKNKHQLNVVNGDNTAITFTLQ